MEHVTYIRVLPVYRRHEVLGIIFDTCSREPNLSYRKKDEIDRWYKNGNILFAFYGDELLGWLVSIPHGCAIELAAGYVAQRWRSKGVFQILVMVSLDAHAGPAIVATFNARLAELLAGKFHFEECSLWFLCRLTHGKFIWSRLNPRRIFAIGRHLEERKPTYLVRYS